MSSPDEPTDPVATASMILVPGLAIPRRPRESTSCWALGEYTEEPDSTGGWCASGVDAAAVDDEEDWNEKQTKSES